MSGEGYGQRTRAETIVKSGSYELNLVLELSPRQSTVISCATPTEPGSKPD